MAETTIIREYVDRDAISESFAGSGLSPEEVDTAAQAIQLSRAQIVVDSIAEELARRHGLLLSERAETAQHLADIDMQLVEFGSNAASSEPEGNTLFEHGPERYRKFFDANMNQSDLQKALESEPPFTLWVSENQYSAESSNDYSLRGWLCMHMRDIKVIYGDKSITFTRAVNSLTLYLRHNFKLLQEEGLISRIITDHAGNKGLVIDSPIGFMMMALEYATNFGAKSAVATLAIADMQRQEHAAVEVD